MAPEEAIRAVDVELVQFSNHLACCWLQQTVHSLQEQQQTR